MQHSRKFIVASGLLLLFACNDKGNVTARSAIPSTQEATLPYNELRSMIREERRRFAAMDKPLEDSIVVSEIIGLWTKAIGVDLYEQWKGTPWDFNGTTTIPQQGTIACGYFVTTVLKDMDLKIDRVKLAICTSMQMMKSLAPTQKVLNLSGIDYDAFDERLKRLGKGVYIVGLDFHTGFIVNDGSEAWFIHSNYIQSAGVMKEAVLASTALKSSKTRWVVSLTGNKDFLKRWLYKQ